MTTPAAKYEIRADDKTAEGIKKAREGLKHMTTGIAAAGAAAAGAAVGMAALWAKTAPSIDNLGKTARNAGLTTEALAGLRLAANFAGLETASLDKAVVKFQRSIGDAIAGTGRASQEIEYLGLSFDDIRNARPEEAIAMIADKVKDLGSASERARILSNLFGREGINLGTMFEYGGGAIRDAAAEARDFGLAISAIDAAKVEEANDAVHRVKSAMQGVANQFTVELAPAVTNVSNALTSLAADGTLKNVAGDVAGFSIGVLTTIAMTVEGTLKAINAIKKANETAAGAGGPAEWLSRDRAEVKALENQYNLFAGSLGKSIGGIEITAEHVEEARGKWVSAKFALAGLERGLKDQGDTTGKTTEALDNMIDSVERLRQGLMAAGNAPPVAPPVAPPPTPPKPGDDTVGAPLVTIDPKDIYGPDVAAYQESLDAKHQALLASFQTEQEALLAKRDNDLALNQELYDRGLTEQETYYAQRTAIEERFVDRSAELSNRIRQQDAQERASKAALVSGSLQSLAQLAQGAAEHNKAAFAAMKAARIADAVVNTYAGANLALATYPPPWGAIAAAGVIAAGMANVASITSTGFGGGGGGGGSAGGGSAPSLGSTRTELPPAPTPAAEEKSRPPTIVNVNLGDAGIVSKDVVRELIDRINEEHGDGYTLNIS